MEYMFYFGESFNNAGSNSIGTWVSSVTNMESMFCLANLFNQDINTKVSLNGNKYIAWDVSNVLIWHICFLMQNRSIKI